MSYRSLLPAAALAIAALAASAAEAETGWTTTDVNMRTCASTRCARILTIPARAEIWVNSCNGWCDVEYAGRRGFVYSRYVVVGRAEPAPPPPPMIYIEPYGYEYEWWYDDYRRTPTRKPPRHPRPPRHDAHPKPPVVHPPQPPRPPKIDRPPRRPAIEHPRWRSDGSHRQSRRPICDPKTGVCR